MTVLSVRLLINSRLLVYLSLERGKSYMQIFDHLVGSVPLTPVLFKGQLYLL